MASQEKRTSRTLLYLALACLAYASIEGVCYLSLIGLREKGVPYEPLPSVLSQRQKEVLNARISDKTPLRGHHPLLGWAPVPLSQKNHAKINSQGIRSEWDYTRDVDANHVRISAFGDSFTFGSEVEDDETWERQLEDENPRLEVLNFGVGAYGLDQAYLRYRREGVSFHSDIIIIGFMSDNIYRNLNVFRPFYSASYADSVYTKPRFSLQKGHLVLFKNPLTTREDYERFVNDDKSVLEEIGRNDYFYQIGYVAGPLDILPSVRVLKIAKRLVKQKLNPVVTTEGSYDPASEAFHLTTRLLKEFYCAALGNDALPLILIYPEAFDLTRQRSSQKRKYQPLLDHLSEEGLINLDAMDALAGYDPAVPADRLTVGGWGHYSSLGNKIVADYLRKYLENHQLVTRKAIEMQRRSLQAVGHCAEIPLLAENEFH